MFVLLEGEIRGRQERGGDAPVFTTEAPTVTGLLPFSRLKNYKLTIRATMPTWGLAYSHTKFGDLLQHLPELSQRLVGMLTDRVRTYTEVEQQSQKLAALGKLSAGLAHELNNPSAAARRSASTLRECLARLREAVRASAIGPDDCALLAEREEDIRVSLKPAQYKDEFARVEREEAIQTWLEDKDVKEAWQLGPLLAEANLTDANLEALASVAGKSLGPELTRFATLLEMDRIADELDHSTARISDLVRAIKEYSYMDQASMQEVDIAQSLDTTLTIMHHKLKRSITVTRDYASRSSQSNGLRQRTESGVDQPDRQRRRCSERRRQTWYSRRRATTTTCWSKFPTTAPVSPKKSSRKSSSHFLPRRALVKGRVSASTSPTASSKKSKA